MPTMSKNLVGIDSPLEVLNGYMGEEVGEAIFIRRRITSNAFTYLSTTLAIRGTIPGDKELEKVMAITSRLLDAIEKLGLSVIIFARDCASLTWCFDELDKMVKFMGQMKRDTIFPVSYEVKQSMIDDQIGRMYTIFFDKDEENCRDDVKVDEYSH
uniref:ADP-ribosyl cyclase/cyclic ADP-ribose hydrolase n=1 Tax=Salix viminalis TaxID=40686 RepID=A0A6N2L188_SALVM